MHIRQSCVVLVVVLALFLPGMVAAGDSGIPDGAGVSSAGLPEGGVWTSYTNRNYVQGLAIQGKHVWAATNAGVVRWHSVDETFENYTRTDDLAGNDVRDVAIDGAGRPWFACDGGVSVLDGATWTSYTTTEGLASNDVNSVAVDGLGHIWAGTASGVSRWDGADWSTITTADGLVDNWVLSVTVHGGALWFGTLGGASKFDGHTWTSYTTADGLVSPYVRDIAIDAGGRVWFATLSGLSMLDGAAWTTYTTTDGLLDNTVNALAVSGAGELWAGSSRSSTAGGAMKSPLPGPVGCPLCSFSGIMSSSSLLAGRGLLGAHPGRHLVPLIGLGIDVIGGARAGLNG